MNVDFTFRNPRLELAFMIGWKNVHRSGGCLTVTIPSQTCVTAVVPPHKIMRWLLKATFHDHADLSVTTDNSHASLSVYPVQTADDLLKSDSHTWLSGRDIRLYVCVNAPFAGRHTGLAMRVNLIIIIFIAGNYL